MKKIPTIFVRNEQNRALVTDQITPGCEWVFEGQGVPSVKVDGTACLVKDGILYKRYDAKGGKKPPADFWPCEHHSDPITGHWPGWVPVGDGPADQWHREAFAVVHWADGTYELVGPKIQGNIYRLISHTLILHGSRRIDPIHHFDPFPTFGLLRQYLTHHAIEGIVWRHPDGRMAKIKRRDFGLPWPTPDAYL